MSKVSEADKYRVRSASLLKSAPLWLRPEAALVNPKPTATAPRRHAIVTRNGVSGFGLNEPNSSARGIVTRSVSEAAVGT